MSTLTEAAFVSKKAFFWSVVGISVIIGGLIFLGIGKRIKNALFPPPPAPATVAFGKLPTVELGAGYKAPAGTTFVLDTITGGFGDFGAYAKVFGVRAPEASFGAFERIKTKAESIHFGGTPQEISPGTFRFVDTRDENRILTVDTVSENFTLETDYLVDTDILNVRPQSEQEAVDTAVAFFENLGTDLRDFPADKVKVRKLRIDGAILIAASVLFAVIMLRTAREKRKKEVQAPPNFSLPISFTILAGGLLLMGAAAYFVVSEGEAIATKLFISPAIIGLLVVALGTTLPELIFSARAVREAHPSLALGDIMGTVIADATLVLGITAAISPFSFNPRLVIVTGTFMLLAGFFSLGLLRSGKELTKPEGALLLVFYAIFIIVEFSLRNWSPFANGVL